MKCFPRGFGGKRTDQETVRREGWFKSEILVISATDPRLTWPERELIQQLGTRLFGKKKRVSP